MLFTEPAFLFVFLPVVLGLYFLTKGRVRAAVLTCASLVFYALGEWRFVPWMIASITLNYVLAIWIERSRESRWRHLILATGIASDLCLLLYFKYASWMVLNVDRFAAALHLHGWIVPKIALPLGISFFTFHKISYKVDVYRGETKAQRNPLTLALYILFFPQLIAGPIVRYHDIADQLERPSLSVGRFADGVRRIIYGLAKKVLIANSVGSVADAVFANADGRISPGTAWLGVVAYTLQIYFDFSGYSDIAIGLASLFGFHFLENFDHPYASQSITEFWRRWHISLSRWFRDYLYVPLGGNRRGRARTYANLVIIFFLCGLWHGASWAFVIWGLYHGAFLVVERAGAGAVLERLPGAIRRIYAILVVMVGWVFFRATSLHGALALLARMAGFGDEARFDFTPGLYLNRWVVLTLLAGAVASFPVRQWCSRSLRGLATSSTANVAIRVADGVGLASLLCLSLTFVAAGTYNPFLYFRF